MHCGLPVFARGERFCCPGCESVYALLRDEGLERYYDLGGGQGAPALLGGTSADHKWLDALDVGSGRLTLDVQGIRCAACVWLFEKLFAREDGALSIVVNPALGKLDMSVGPTFSVRAFVEQAEKFGYRLGPALKGEGAQRDDLLTRMGVCIAIAMNAMIFAFAIYAGLNEGPIFRLFEALELGLGALSVLVGGTVFFRAAFQSLRSGIVHLDVPIATGIALAFSSSAYAYFAGSSRTYFDTLTVFIALMLVGRWLQERLVERSRRQILASDGAEGLLARKIADDRVSIVRCKEIGTGDRLLVTPGDLVPVDADLEDASGVCSLDWINGESAPRTFRQGELVPAGAFNAGQTAFSVCSRSDFEASPVLDLLRATRERPGDASRATPWWRRFAKVYVGLVFVVAALGFGGWLLVTGDLQRSLEVTAGILIVTCPCAFGIATPMAYELVYAGLRRAGLFVRSSGFLDRAREIERVVFDKTGTLTTGTLRVVNADALDVLDAQLTHVLFNIVARSSHPKSIAIARALDRRAKLSAGMPVREETGKGLVLDLEGHTYRVRGDEDDVVFTVDNQIRARIVLAEQARSDAKAEIEALSAMGYETWILSGDTQARVDKLASDLGVPHSAALGGRSPSDKAQFLDAHPRALMIGDGLNDALAVEHAFASGTPAIDRPFLPACTDFYFTAPGLKPVTLALSAAHALARVTRRNLTVAVAYNVVSVALAWAGLLSPLVCAVVMPLSSISVVALTVASLSQRSSLWRS